MRVLLLRHGATDWNLAGRCQGASDIELNAAGVAQAQAAAAALAAEKIDAIYSSRLSRALETARALARVHNLPVTVEENLRELDHGELEGLTFAEIQSARPDFLREWRERPASADIPGGEKLSAVGARAWAALDAIAARHRPEETLAVVSHNFPILAVICRITATPLDRYRLYHVAPGGMVRLDYAPEAGWRFAENDKPPLREP